MIFLRSAADFGLGLCNKKQETRSKKQETRLGVLHLASNYLASRSDGGNYG